MRIRVLTLSLLVAIAAACAPKADTDTVVATGTAEDEAAIRATNASYGTLWTSRDTTAMLAMTSDRYQEVLPDGTHNNGKPATSAMMGAMFAAMPPGMALTVNTAYVSFVGDDVAVSGGTWTTTGGPMGAQKGSFSVTHVKEDGTWRSITSLAATDMPVPTMDAQAIPAPAPVQP